MIVVANLNKFEKRINRDSRLQRREKAVTRPRPQNEEGVASRGLQPRAQVEEGQDLHRSTGSKSTGERDRVA
jgi:hypothetical protein